MLAYAAGAFVLVQAADVIVAALGLPRFLLTLLVVLALLGLPPVAVGVWLIERKLAGAPAARLRYGRRTRPALVAFAMSVLLIGGGLCCYARVSRP